MQKPNKKTNKKNEIFPTNKLIIFMPKPNQIMLWINQTKPFSTSILVCPYDGVSRRSIDNWFVAVGSATWLKRALYRKQS